jgi:hypothetical protein
MESYGIQGCKDCFFSFAGNEVANKYRADCNIVSFHLLVFHSYLGPHRRVTPEAEGQEAAPSANVWIWGETDLMSHQF